MAGIFLPVDTSSDEEEDLMANDADVFKEAEQEADSEEDNEQDEAGGNLSIELEQARLNYVSAGTEVMEGMADIKLEDYKAVMDEGAVALMDKVVDKVQLPYSLASFQRIAVAVLGSGHDVVLVQATGSGKMTIPLLVAKMRRQVVPRGVAIVTQHRGFKQQIHQIELF